MDKKVFEIPEKMQAIEIKAFGLPENLIPCSLMPSAKALTLPW